MRIHLISPRNPPSFWTYDAILPTLGRQCLFPNLSVPTVAGLTPPEHEVTICDENVEPIDFDVEADVIGVTGYIIHSERIHEIVDAFRARGRFVVVGGPYASVCPDALRGRCDVLFVDEAEETWPRFLRDFEAGSWQSEYRAEDKPDLTDGPMPRFDLLKVDRYHAMTVQFARGCPFNCEFCDIIVVYGRRPRMKSVANAMAEIRECHRLGARQVFIVDDNFIGNRKQAKELLRALADWGRANDYPLVFNTEVSLDVAGDDELLALLRDANFITVFIGIETPRVESLLEARKTQNTRNDLLESVHHVQSFGIQVQAGMIVGFDHDDPAIFEEQRRFIQEARIPVSMTGMLNAIPLTPLYDRVKREGRLVAEMGGDQLAFSNLIPAGMTRHELFAGYRRLLAELYAFDSFRDRALGYLRHRGERVAASPVGRHELSLFVRVLRETLFRSGLRRARFTLGLLCRALWQRPSAFPEAVSLALIHKGLSEYARGVDPRLARVLEGL